MKIALLGHDSRNDNLGVGALTVSEVELIRRIARRRNLDIKIEILIGAGRRFCCVEGEDVAERFVRPMRKPLGLWAAIRNCDFVIDVSGGDSFSDIYGGRRILQILMQKYLVHLARRPLIMAPQTIGPFRQRLWHILAKESIQRTAIVATRDNQSMDLLAEMGIRGRQGIILASDMALRLPYVPPRSRKEGKIRVGLNVSGLLMSGGYTGKNMFSLRVDYPNLIREIVVGFLTHRDDCELHLIGHVISMDRTGIEDDYGACLALANEFPEAVVAPAFQTPSEAKSYIAEMDFFMGARMHACIAAFSSGVPVVPMAYSRKFAGLFGSLGYDLTVDCTSDDSETIQDRIFAAFDARSQIADQMAEALQKGLDRLDSYEQELERLLTSPRVQ